MTFYKVTNVSGQRITLRVLTPTGEIEDTLEEDEVCYGLNERAAHMLRFYALMGAIKIEEADKFRPDAVNWLAEGF
jgi:hypothetical protein